MDRNGLVYSVQKDLRIWKGSVLPYELAGEDPVHDPTGGYQI